MKSPLGLAASIVAPALLAGPAAPQEAPLNMVRVGDFVEPGQVYADVWGDGDHAYVGHHQQSRVDIVDVSDPRNPSLAASYFPAPPHDDASAQDVKVANGLLFIALEEDEDSSAEIVDVRDPSNPRHLAYVDVAGFERVHNLFYLDGWLYLANGENPLLAVVDLRSFDPDDPPAVVDSAAWIVQSEPIYNIVHDMTAQGGRLYVSAWYRLLIYDVSGNATRAPRLLASEDVGNAVHSAWPTADGRFLVVAEEKPGGGLALYEVLGGGASLVLRDTYDLDTSRATSVHNPVVSGHRVYASYYQAGVHVLDIHPGSKTWALTASYDTTARTDAASGCWGVYPLLGDDRILASDLRHGLLVLASRTVYVDARNDGFEDGSAAFPFNTIREGADAVGARGRLIVLSGSYAEALTLEGKPFSIAALGGPVDVGP